MHRWLIRNILFPLHERAKGHATFSILREMEAADRLSAPELNQLSNAKLQDLIHYCYAHVPYVRAQMQEAGIEPSRIREPQDLTLLPIMRKADLRKHSADLRSDIAGKLVSLATGGSTGDPLIFQISKRRIASRVACRQRVSKWWGVSVGDPELVLWGSPIELGRQSRLQSLRDFMLATRLLSAFEMNQSTMSQYLNVLERGHYRQIFGYPSAIYQLCLHARKNGRNLRRLGVKVVFVTSEVLFPYQRELISETLNCPTANGYGGRDSGFVSHECPQGGMHVLMDAAIVEVVDSQRRILPPGQAGEIVVTDLYSHEAPFLRYATGDIGVCSSRRCPCGRALPLLESIDGRSNDCIIAPDGRIINSLALVYPLRELRGIEQFRITQRSVDRFHVQIVRNDDFEQDGEDRLRTAWGRLLRTRLNVTFEYVSHFPSDRSGKFRHVVSELPLQAAEETALQVQRESGV